MIVPNTDQPIVRDSRSQELRGFIGIYRKRLFHVGVSPVFKASRCERQVGMGRRGDVHDIGLDLGKHSVDVFVTMRDAKARRRLICEIGLTIANSNNGGT